MLLHPTLSEECIQYSIKKYFYSGLKAVDGVPVYFAHIYMTPKASVSGIEHDTWVKFFFGGAYPVGGLSVVKVGAYVFSRGSATASSGNLLAQTRDKLMAYLVNTDPAGNGIQAIPLLDLTNVECSRMVVTLGEPSDEEEADDNTLYRLIPIRLKFATI